jgi:hypothetical protein
MSLNKIISGELLMIKTSPQMFMSNDDFLKIWTLIRQAYKGRPDLNSWSFAMFDIWSQQKIGDSMVHGNTAWESLSR